MQFDYPDIKDYSSHNVPIEKKKSNIFIILLFILTVLYITNPAMTDYKEWFQEKVNYTTKDDGFLISLFSDMAASKVDMVTVRNNYYIFSIFNTNIMENKVTVLGVLKFFIPIEGNN
jgi:hypothetical protein